MDIAPDPGTQVLVLARHAGQGDTPIPGRVEAGNIVSTMAEDYTLAAGEMVRVFAQLDSDQTMVASAEVLGSRSDRFYLRILSKWSPTGERSAPRFAAVMDAWIVSKVGGGGRSAGRIRDLSLSGAAVETLKPPPFTGPVSLTIMYDGRSATIPARILSIEHGTPAVLHCRFGPGVLDYQQVFIRQLIALLAEQRGWSQRRTA